MESNAESEEINENSSSDLVKELKKKGDKAYRDGKYEKAYAIYQNALRLDEKNYDVMACLIGAALNLGYLDDVWNKSELLIQMDEQKAQGYFLKGVANDLIFNFELAIECFTKALHFEKEHPNLILKNLIKSIAKYLDRDENFQFDDSTDLDNEDENLIKLIELVEILIDKRKIPLSLNIINYIESLDKKNPIVRAEQTLVMGKLFKSEKNYEKALLAFEECFYLGFSMDDYRLKIKSIVSISSCYLEIGDLHKAILYYQKLIDIETYLLESQENMVQTEFNATNEEIINLELRIAIRQNLYMTHLRLGKLRICTHYLKELIEIINKCLKLDDNNIDIIIIEEFFEFVHVKIDASLELSKLYYYFEDFASMQSLLQSMIDFSERVIENDNSGTLTSKQLSILCFFRIKSYSMIGLCLAGLREFRNSKIATKRSLCLVEQEMDHKSSSLSSLESISNSSMINHIKSLQVECLIDACWSLRQFSRTFKHMRRFNNEILNSLESRFVSHEVKLLIEASRERISFAKNAYLISTRIIDPNLRVQSTFNLALSLYENGFFQSAAYYFDQLLSISVSLIKNDRPRSTDFYNDLNPDYHLESAVYLVKSHLMIDYFDLKSSSDEDKYEFKAESLEALLQRVSKSLETIIRYMIKWKVEETNRASFHFNQSNLNALKTDADSKRLRKIFKTACECVVYICFKLNDFNKALVYMDAYDFLVNSSINDLIDFNLVSENIDDVNVNASDLFKFDNFTRNCQLLGNTLIRYKFIFDCKLMYIFIMDSKSANIIHSSCTKLSQILHDIDEHLFDSKLDFFNSQLNMIHNEWIKANLNDFEYRNLPIEKIELEKLRIENRLKDFKLFEHFLKDGVNKSNYFYEYNLESIDLIGLRFSDALTESISCEDIRSLETNLSKQLSVRKSIDEMVEIAREIILKPIESFIVSTSSISLLIDSKFVKLFALAYNSNLYKVTFCPDSFIFCSMKLLRSGEKDGIDEKVRDLSKKKVLSYPIRSKPVETSTKSIDKLEVTPRYTSNPKLAVSFLNGRTSPNNGPNPVERAKSRLDMSISVLISQTYTGTDAKRSTLEIIPYKQLTRVRKCSVLGCPQIPIGLSKASSFKIDKFLKTGLAQMSKICDILCPQTRPTFGSECTKKQLIDDLESSSLVFLSTLSSNQSDSVLVCAESIESPSSFSDEYKKYCLFDSTDLESIDMHKCALLVLNCYSSLNHKPRLKLAKKLLSRGCKCVLLVISPLSDQLMTQFYCLFFNELKSLRSIVLSYSSAVHKLCEANSELTKLIWSSFCLLSANEKLELDLDELEKSMSQMAIDKTFEQLRKDQNVDYLNPEPRVSILSSNFQSCLERTLNQLQILVKFLFNQSISASKDDGGLQFRETLLYLNEIVSKSIAYMAFTKAKPEILDPIAQENFVVMNLLKLLGFTSHRESIYVVRDHKEKFALFYPDNRYMDLCLRTTHIIGSVLEMRFGSYMNNNSETSFRVRTVLNQLEALLPIPKPLLNSLVDIISLTRFSPEIILSLTDDSIQTALAYSRNQFDHFYLINKDIYKWSSSDNSEAKKTLDTDMKPIKNYINNNNVLNFLLSLGFEVIGNWLHFSNTQFNSILLELALKFLSSFHPDRDMSLYKEMNLNVLGDRSATRSRTNQLSKSADSIKKKQSNEQQADLFDVLVAEPWGTEIEERRDMNLKIQVVEKYKQLSAKLSKQRSDAIRNHINYVMKQSVVNKLAITKIDNNAEKKADEQVVDESSKKTPKVVIKYKPGGGPSKSRTIVNERYKITYEEISKLRAYSHFACQTNVEKINQEAKEKTQKVILPLIKK